MAIHLCNFSCSSSTETRVGLCKPDKTIYVSLCHYWEDLDVTESPKYDLSFPTLDCELYTAGNEVPSLWNTGLMARVICVLPQSKALSSTEV